MYHPFFLDRISLSFPVFSPSHFKFSRFECLVIRTTAHIVHTTVCEHDWTPAGISQTEQRRNPWFYTCRTGLHRQAIYTFLWLDKLLFDCTQNDGFSTFQSDQTTMKPAMSAGQMQPTWKTSALHLGKKKKTSKQRKVKRKRKKSTKQQIVALDNVTRKPERK